VRGKGGWGGDDGVVFGVWEDIRRLGIAMIMGMGMGMGMGNSGLCWC
jgi:hypothetical protein